MSYRVKLTQSAVEQAQEIVQYISETLLVPDVAQAWMSRLKAEIGKLSSCPTLLYGRRAWRSKGIRRAVVENFLVYFWIRRTTGHCVGDGDCVRAKGSHSSSNGYATAINREMDVLLREGRFSYALKGWLSAHALHLPR